MTKRTVNSPDREEARKILDELWSVVLNDESYAAPRVIRDLVNSGQTAIRFCLPTQLLGKLTDNDLVVKIRRKNPAGMAEIWVCHPSRRAPSV